MVLGAGPVAEIGFRGLFGSGIASKQMKSIIGDDCSDIMIV